MFCVRFKGDPCSVGYLRPWNSVRDGETYSLTYLPTSIIDGISEELGCNGKIIRHKLRFNGMTEEMIKSPKIDVLGKKGKPKTKRESAVSKIHQLRSPEIILGFDNLDDAINASRNVLYVGQTQYMIFPVSFRYNDDEENNDEDIIVEMNEDDFSSLEGTETFEADKYDDDAIYCGNNRHRNNERMYIKIVRTR